ncbi:MAG TPA: hypothetical protein VNB90_10740 [Cytophagaceae bacterium]|nr:hypothetical protein [Cytophagaceae bacterium]
MQNLLTGLTGINALSNEKLLSKDNKLKGLLNEEITQGGKLKLNKIIRKIQEELTLIEKMRVDLVNECKGNAETLESNTPQYQQFIKKFTEVAMEKNNIEIEPLSIERTKVEDIVSEFNYQEIIELLFEA